MGKIGTPSPKRVRIGLETTFGEPPAGNLDEATVTTFKFAGMAAGTETSDRVVLHRQPVGYFKTSANPTAQLAAPFTHASPAYLTLLTGVCDREPNAAINITGSDISIASGKLVKTSGWAGLAAPAIVQVSGLVGGNLWLYITDVTGNDATFDPNFGAGAVADKAGGNPVTVKVDRTFLLQDDGSTTRGITLEAFNAATNQGEHLSGAVVNKWALQVPESLGEITQAFDFTGSSTTTIGELANGTTPAPVETAITGGAHFLAPGDTSGLGLRINGAVADLILKTFSWEVANNAAQGTGLGRGVGPHTVQRAQMIDTKIQISFVRSTALAFELYEAARNAEAAPYSFSWGYKIGSSEGLFIIPYAVLGDGDSSGVKKDDEEVVTLTAYAQFAPTLGSTWAYAQIDG